MSKLQLVIMIVFGIAALLAVGIFSGYIPGLKGGGGTGEAVELSLWGTFSYERLSAVIGDFEKNSKNSFKLNYVQKKSDTFEEDLLNALASGNGPDIWISSQDYVLKDKGKIFPLSLSSYKERTFRDNFIDGAGIFIDRQNNSIVGLPLAIDPIVLFWNRDLFSSAGLTQPPKYWDEFLTDVEILTKQDANGNIIQAGTAMGEFYNIKNAKEIISLLILQSGNPIVKSDTLEVTFGQKGNGELLNPAENALRFFTEFSNPSKSSYSWSRSLPDSRKMFAAGSLAMYFGYASEVSDIKLKNPHLNFDIGEVSQIKDGKITATFGKIYNLVVSKNSKKSQAALNTIQTITGFDFSKSFSESFGLGSARRDVLAVPENDPLLSVVNKSAIISRSWLEPDPDKVSLIFKDMIESVVTGRLQIAPSVSTAEQKIKQLLGSQ